MSSGALQAPVRVLCVDADDPARRLTDSLADELTDSRADENAYTSALVFFQRRGRVVGHVQVKPGFTDDDLRTRLADVDDDQVAPARTPVDLPRVSVVVPTTMDRTEALRRTLRSLVAQDHGDFEAIIVDNRPDFGPERAALYQDLASDPRIRFTQEPVRGISAARNRGIAESTAGIVAFTDDDVEVSRHWLRSIASRFAAEPATDCVTGLVLPAALDTQPQLWFEASGGKIDQRFRKLTYQADHSKSRHVVEARDDRDQLSGPPTHIYRGKFGMGANMAFRKPALIELGGFDLALGAGTRARGGEDIAMISRLLYDSRALTFDPAVVVHHHHRREFDELRSQMRGYGLGYTAALTALAHRDRRHVRGVLSMLTTARGVAEQRSDQRDAGEYPRSLSRTEKIGLLLGPIAYLRSAWTTRAATARRTAITEVTPAASHRVSNGNGRNDHG